MTKTNSEISINKTLPCNLEAERSVLGAIFLDARALFSAVDYLKTEDFYLESHRKIYDAMLQLSNQGKPIDLVLVKNELQRFELLEKCGGAAYLTSLTDGLPRATNVEYYAKIVREQASLRRLIQLSSETMTKAYEAQDTFSDILNQAEQAIFEISSRQFRSGFVPMESLVSLTYKEIEELSTQKSRITGLETGLYRLDRMTAGLHPQDLLIIAARPGLGKTSLCLNIAQFIAVQRQKTVGIFSLEMSKEQLIRRMLSTEAEIDAQRIRTGTLNKDDWYSLSQACGTIQDAKIYIDDTSSITISEMRSKARRLALEKGLDLIIVDYLQLMTGSSYSRRENRNQEIGEISRGLKSIAKELNIPVIAVSQLSRAIEMGRGEVRKPQLSDLRDSGSIEQDADVVIFIYRQDMVSGAKEENTGIAEIIIGKQRNGPTGSFEVAFVKQFTKFINMWRE
jgi:replicative DNA helicase